MDTLTHTCMGVGLVAFGTIDPSIQSTSLPFIITAITASQIPDIDTVLKLTGNANYITHHRGFTHSLPMQLIWPILITALIYLVFKDINILHYYLFAQLGVSLHIFVDIFNAYGTQALRPFSNQWIQLAVINTIDYFILLMHGLGFILWYFIGHGFIIFTIIYIILILYYISRFYYQYTIKKYIHNFIDSETIEQYFIAPTMRYKVWRIAIRTSEYDYVGRAHGLTINFYDKFKRKEPFNFEKYPKIKHDKNVRAFIHFSPFYRYEWDHARNELRFIDLRYLEKGHYPFVAIVKYDDQFNVPSSYTGWVFSEDKLQQKVPIQN